MGRQHRQFVETPTDRLKEAMDIVEMVAFPNRHCELAFIYGCEVNQVKPAAYCVPCRAKALIEREEGVQSSLRDVRRARKRTR